MARLFGGLCRFWVFVLQKKLQVRLGHHTRITRYDASTSESGRAIRDTTLKPFVEWRCVPCERFHTSRALRGIFEQENCQMPTRRIVLCSHHGAAGDGDDRQGNGPRRGNAAGLSSSEAQSWLRKGTLAVTLEEIRVEIDEIHLAGDHNAVRLTTTISRDDFDDAVPNTLAKRERQEWIDDHADALADLALS
jgi:hypothetical protein